jgi:hypothetical protein
LGWMLPGPVKQLWLGIFFFFSLKCCGPCGFFCAEVRLSLGIYSPKHICWICCFVLLSGGIKGQ